MKNFLLYPFSILFRLIVYIRNKLYDNQKLRTKSLNARVISVGNLSAGGTGKTPLVELISEYLLKKNKFIAIICKGYKRDADDIIISELSFDNENLELSSELIGDEPAMLQKNLSKVKQGRGLIVIADNKSSGAKLVDSKFRPDIIIIDDGFQHRKISRELDIVMLSNEHKDKLIPAGRMREPYSSLKRACIVVVNSKFGEDLNLERNIKLRPSVYCNYEVEKIENINGEQLNNFKDKTSVAFCGIADPESFKQLLSNINKNVSSFISFPDHHTFSSEDLDNIISAFTTTKADYIITTEKDFVRLKYSSSKDKRSVLSNYPIYYAKIKLHFTKNERLFYENINELLSN